MLESLGFVGLVWVAGTDSPSHWKRLEDPAFGVAQLQCYRSLFSVLSDHPGDKTSWAIKQERNLVLFPKLLHSSDHKSLWAVFVFCVLCVYGRFNPSPPFFPPNSMK